MIDNEVGLITIGFMGIQTRMLLWGTEFTLIFAYLAALYFFLRYTSVGFRLFTFTIFAMTISFMWIGFAGTDIGSERYFQARSYAIDQGMLPPYWTNAAAPYIGKLLTTASFLGHTLHAIGIIGAFYITFFYHWQAKP
jgi:hypothetical protein